MAWSQRLLNYGEHLRTSGLQLEADFGWRNAQWFGLCSELKKEKPAAGKTDYWRDFWRSGWDSNPRNLAVQLISSQSRYDHFDTAPYLSQHQHLRKRGELMGRTSKNIKLRIPEKPRKIKGFRTGSYRVATTISSQPRYDHFDTAAYQIPALHSALLLYHARMKKTSIFLNNGKIRL